MLADVETSIGPMTDMSAPPMRKTPRQDRAKAKVEHILDCAEALIGEQGISALNTKALAARANVAVGSVYQYFTGQDQIIAAICNRYFERIRQNVETEFSQVQSLASFAKAARAALEYSWNLTTNTSASHELFYGVEAWAVVRETDWRFVLANAETMVAVLKKIMPGADDEKLAALCAIICGSAGNISRMAARFGHLRQALFEEFFEMTESRLYTLQRESDQVSRGQ